MLFQNHKLIKTVCTSLALAGFSLGGAVNASETAINTDRVHFQGREYHYPPANVLSQPVNKSVPWNITAPRAQSMRPAARPPVARNYNTARPPVNRAVPYGRPPVSRPGPYSRPPVNRPGSYNRPPVNRPGSYGRPGTIPPQARPGYMPPPPRPAGAPPLNPPFAGPGSRSIPGKSDVVILDPDVPKKYANNPYINHTYNSAPPPYAGGPGNSYRRSGNGGNGPFKNMGFGPFNGNSAPWESWPFGNRDSFWNRKEVPFKSLKPRDWFDPGDPKEGLANMWDDLIAAPDDLGTMPGGWNVPSVSTPNPVDLEDQLQKASKQVPDIIRVYND